MAFSEGEFGGKVSWGMKDVYGHQGVEATARGSWFQYEIQ